MRVYRTITNQQRWRKLHGITDAHVLTELAVPAPRLLKSLARVRLLIRLVQRAYMHVLVSLSHAKGARRSWVLAVQRDLEWMAQHSNALSDFRGAALATWIRFLTAAPTQAKQLLHKVALDITTKACTLTMATATADGDAAHDPALAVSFHCSHCRLDFPSYQQYAVHTARKHGARRVARRYAKTRICSICLQAFGSRSQLVDHLAEMAEICILNLVIFAEPLTLEDTAALDAKDAAVEKITRSTIQPYWCQGGTNTWPCQAAGCADRTQPSIETSSASMGAGRCRGVQC